MNKQQYNFCDKIFEQLKDVQIIKNDGRPFRKVAGILDSAFLFGYKYGDKYPDRYKGTLAEPYFVAGKKVKKYQVKREQ